MGGERDDMAEPSAPARDVLSFGRFALFPGERLLTADGAPVDLGARTLDMLIALASRPNEVIGKQALMAAVWPDVTVDEGSLRFHVAALRKALGDGKDGARYIATLTGRGYCFVAPVTRTGDQAAASAPEMLFLPARPAHMVGRAEETRILATRLTASRFVTIVGPGGVGKTTLAVAVAHDLLDAFAGAVLFVDLGLLTEPRAVAPSLASMLGLSVQSDDATPGVAAYLRDRPLLLILDGCEHVIEGAARLAADIFVAAPKVAILATSREALRVDGEWVHSLPPLALPPEDPRLTAAAALAFPATQLFVERALAHGARLDFGDADAPIVAGICRKLDGVALAIELAAGRVAAYGLEQIAAFLDQRLALQWRGKRTAPPRQQSLQATLDWSYGLLSELERAVLRRLAAFVGHFTLEAAQAVAAGAAVDPVRLLGAIDSLVGKSMVATRRSGAGMRYRLLDTTRAYLHELTTDADENADLAARHATYYRQWLEKTAASWPGLSNAAHRASHLADLTHQSVS
jgi:predicted ATPase/DNA-binding winged helix-turn-helix (wHTH) protein